jgi:hypothetical protein
MLNRRLFVKYGLLGGCALGLGGLGLTLQKGRPTDAPEGGLKSLSPRQWATLVAAVAVINPGSEKLASAVALKTARKMDRLIASLDPDLQGELGLILSLLENPIAGAIFDGNFRPFSSLSAKRRSEVIKAWQVSSINLRRAAIKSLLGLVHSCYWSQPETWAHMGYPGPPALGGASGG